MRLLSTLRSQLVALVATAVVSSNLAVIAGVESTRQTEFEKERMNAVAERIAAVFRHLSTIPQEQRLTAVVALSGTRFGYSIAPDQPLGNHEMNNTERLLALHLESREPSNRFGPAIARLTRPYISSLGNGQIVLEVSQTIAHGQWLFARFAGPPTPSPTRSIAAAAVICTMLTGAAAAWLAERAARPLSRLAQAAHQVANGQLAVRLSSAGPRDFERTAAAFNRMSDHVTETAERHRKLLAAIGHDLRTPLAAIRLSAEFVDDETLRERLHCDLNDLQSVTETILLTARSSNAATAPLESATN